MSSAQAELRSENPTIRGRGALSTSRGPHADGRQLVWLEPGQIRTNSVLQPRCGLEESALIDLANSVKNDGIIEPLIVRPAQDHFEIICGHRRFEAGKRVGLSRFPALIRNLGDANALLLSLQENIQRASLNPIEEALAYRRLIETGAVSSQRELAQRLGLTQGRISQKMACAQLPQEIHTLFQDSDPLIRPLTELHARTLRRVSDSQTLVQFARQAHADGLSARDLDQRIRKAGVGRASRNPAPRTARRLRWIHQDARCRYVRTGRGMRVEIEATDDRKLIASLEALVTRLKKNPGS